MWCSAYCQRTVDSSLDCGFLKHKNWSKFQVMVHSTYDGENHLVPVALGIGTWYCVCDMLLIIVS